MTGVIFATIVYNAVIFSFIFWILTFLAKYLYTNNYSYYKYNFYECGFKSLTKNNIKYNINFLLLLLFLLLYDGEFLILIPFSFNAWALSLSYTIALVFFIIWLFIALLFDYIYGALDWQIVVRVHFYKTKTKTYKFNNKYLFILFF